MTLEEDEKNVKRLFDRNVHKNVNTPMTDPTRISLGVGVSHWMDCVFLQAVKTLSTVHMKDL